MNDTKKTFRFALIVATLCGLCLAATSCKDDDNKDNDGEDMEQWESTGSSLSMEDGQLSSLISNFADVQESELLQTSGWQQKTYEAELGLVLDQSRPNVRTIEVGTVEYADERALTLLNELGIDGTNPSGFTYNNANVGTVSYQHGGGSDANTLAVINIDVKQLPGISQLRMVKELPANAATFGYYSQGDIVRKDGRLWICTTPALKEGDKTYFITLRNTHSTDNCKWGTYKDYVYNRYDPMADYTQVANWLYAFVMDPVGYNETINHLNDAGIDTDDVISQLIPSNDNQRRAFLKQLYYDIDSIPVEPLILTQWIEKNKWGPTPKANGRYCSPHGMLLANKFRYALSPCEYWVPFICWTKGNNKQAMVDKLNRLASQVGTRNGDHFQHHISNVNTIDDNEMATFAGDREYIIVNAAVYWTHSYFGDNRNQWAMFNFLQDWADHPELDQKITTNPWISRNVTSKQMDFVDTGLAKAGLEPVWIRRDPNKTEPTVQNKDDDESGVYAPGDVVKDEEGSYWMCVMGSSVNDEITQLTDKTAWFVSFDNIKTDDNGQPSNILTEDEIEDAATIFINGVYSTSMYSMPGVQFSGDSLGVWKNARDFAGIDMHKLVMIRDSVWEFHGSNNEDIKSSSRNFFSNFAYKGKDGQLKVMRGIFNMTYSGDRRTSAPVVNGSSLDYQRITMFKHYEVFDQSRMEPLTDDHKTAKMTLWQLDWPVSDDEMRFSDLSNQAMVDKYAAKDKWVRLPLNGTTQRRQPRTAVNGNDMGWRQYLYNRATGNFANPNALSMFNEPILFMRVMKVTDNGGLTPNLISQDGRRLTVVSLQDNETIYRASLIMLTYYGLYSFFESNAVLIDNQEWTSPLFQR